MNTHLTPEELLAVGDHAPLAPSAARHLATCELCRREADALRALIVELQQAEVPEPSPLFWEQFSGRVAAAVRDAEPLGGDAGDAAGWWRRWTHWGWTLGGATVTAALLLVAFSPWTAVSPPAPERASSASAPAPEDPVVDAEDGEDWALIAEAAGGLEYDEVRAIGAAIPPGVAELAVQDLDAEEQRELVRLLEAEIAQAGRPAGAVDTL